MISDIIDHFYERELYKSAIYGAFLAAGFVVLTGLIVTAPRPLLVSSVLLVSASLIVNYIYVPISGRPISLDVMEWLPHEMSQLSRAWDEFRGEFLLSVVKTALFIGVLLASRAAIRRDERLSPVLKRSRAWLVSACAFTSFHVAAGILQPPQMMAETNIVVFGIPAFFATTPDLRPVSVSPVRGPLAQKIVLIVDESVSHAIYEKIVAPTLSGPPPIDFGEAASVANCSAATNALLRWGVEKARVGKPGYDPRTNPTIWAYARAAGYRTSLIDGQSDGAMHNYVGTKEFALIDEFIPARSGIATDRGIAAKLNEILRRAGPDFVYVVKRGVHFPYEMNYPADNLPSDATRSAKYARAVSYATAGFFEGMAANVDFSHTLVIYTSDHGQDLAERSTHCNPKPRDVEYSVPLVAITAAPGLRALLENANGMHARASHLNIFPTLLYAFGYSREWLEAEYGQTLAGPPGPYLIYVSLGWQGPAAARNRHTVDTTEFVKSTGFPRRSGARAGP